MAKKEKKEIVNLGHGVGRRKSAVARVYLREGNGTITVNGKNVDEYFVDALSVFTVKQPLVLTETADKFDVVITVSGGGINGQAGARRHALETGLCEEDNDAYRSALHAAGFMTRDPRMVERKKYGQRGARRRFQFSKR